MYFNTQIKFDPNVLREIYDNLLNQDRNAFRKGELKSVLVVVISIVVFLVPFLANDFYQFIPFSIVAFFISILIAFRTILKRIRYNRSQRKLVKEIFDWIDLKSKVNNYNLIADEEKLILYEDEVPTEFKWNNIVQKNINDEFIWIRTNNDQTLILPNKLLSANDNEILKNLIDSNSKNNNEL